MPFRDHLASRSDFQNKRPRARLKYRVYVQGCCECLDQIDPGGPEEILHFGALQQLDRFKAFFSFPLTTSRGENTQLQAGTACWWRQGSLPAACDACPIDAAIRGKDLEKWLRASSCTGAGSLILRDVLATLCSSPISSMPAAMVENTHTEM